MQPKLSLIFEPCSSILLHTKRLITWKQKIVIFFDVKKNDLFYYTAYPKTISYKLCLKNITKPKKSHELIKGIILLAQIQHFIHRNLLP